MLPHHSPQFINVGQALLSECVLKRSSGGLKHLKFHFCHSYFGFLLFCLLLIFVQHRDQSTISDQTRCKVNFTAGDLCDMENNVVDLELDSFGCYSKHLRSK